MFFSILTPIEVLFLVSNLTLYFSLLTFMSLLFDLRVVWSIHACICLSFGWYLFWNHTIIAFVWAILFSFDGLDCWNLYCMWMFKIMSRKLIHIWTKIIFILKYLIIYIIFDMFSLFSHESILKYIILLIFIFSVLNIIYLIRKLFLFFIKRTFSILIEAMWASFARGFYFSNEIWKFIFDFISILHIGRKDDDHHYMSLYPNTSCHELWYCINHSIHTYLMNKHIIPLYLISLTCKFSLGVIVCHILWG